MNSIILRAATLYLQPILLLFSVFLLLSGHNAPGGGFTGGLMAASGFVLYALAFSVPEARRLLRVDPQFLIGLGLLVAMGSALVSMAAGMPLMTGLWTEIHVPGFGKVPLGTPLLFDAGVYLDVVGVATMIIFSMAEEDGKRG